MVLRTGRKNLNVKDKEEIKSLLRNCELFRYDEDQTLEYLEDKGFQIGRTTLYSLKKELREEIGSRLEEIGRYELVFEHELALEMLKYLQKEMMEIMTSSDVSINERIRASSEIRALIRDIVDLYDSKEIVNNVYRHFQERYPEAVA